MADKKISALTAASTPLAGTEDLPIVQSGSIVKVSVSNLTTGRDVSMKRGTSTDGFYISGVGKVLYFDTTGEAQSNQIATVNDFNLQMSCGRGSTSYVTAASDSVRLGVGGVEQFRVNTSGNLAVLNAGKGIDFSANANAPGMTSELLTWYEEGDFTVTPGANSGLNGTWTAGTGKYTRIGNRVDFTIQFTGSGIGFSSTLGYYNFSGLPFTCAAEGSSGTWATLSVSGALAGAVVIVGSSSEFWLYAPNNTGTADAVSVCGSYRV